MKTKQKVGQGCTIFQWKSVHKIIKIIQFQRHSFNNKKIGQGQPRSVLACKIVQFTYKYLQFH